VGLGFGSSVLPSLLPLLSVWCSLCVHGGADLRVTGAKTGGCGGMSSSGGWFVFVFLLFSLSEEKCGQLCGDTSTFVRSALFV